MRPFQKYFIFICLSLFMLILFTCSDSYAFLTITITPGRLDRYKIITPHKVRAGKNFTVKIIALDDFGNIITNFAAKNIGSNIIVKYGRNLDKKISLPASEFKKGVVKFNISYKKEGRIFIESSFEGVEGKSAPIKIYPGPFNNLKIKSPAEVTAGKTFRVNVYAEDQYGNPVDIPKNSVIKVFLTGDNFKVHPRILPPQSIRNGFGRYNFISDRSGMSQLNFEIQNDGENPVFSSKNIEIQPAGLYKFHISLNVAHISAGKPFMIKLVPVDMYGNVIQNINKIKGKVKLSLISDSGVERSSIINFKDFVKGIALIKTIFNKVGTFSIHAKPIGVSINQKIKRNKIKIKNIIPPNSLLLSK